MTTELQRIFEDPNLNGVHHLSAGRGVCPTLDARTISGKDALLMALSDALLFPDYFGVNWDALEEALLDCSWLEGDIVVHVAYADSLAPQLLETLIEIFLSASDYWRERGRGCNLFLSKGGAVPDD